MEYKKFISKQTLKSLGTLMSGTLISALIPIIASPIITRLFLPEYYGILGLYTSINTIIGSLAFSHYPQAIMLAKDSEKAKKILWFSIYFLLACSIVYGVAIAILLTFTSLMDKTVGLWYIFAPLSMMFNGLNSILMLWGLRNKSYTNIASNRVIQALLTVIVQISLGYAIKNETGLMVGMLFGQFLSAFMLVYRFMIVRGEENVGMPGKIDFKGIAVSYKSLLIYATPSEFINNLINQTPIFLLQKFGGPVFVGNFVFTQRLLGLPQQFLSSAIVEVFKQKASEAYAAYNNCKQIYVKTFKILLGLALIPFIVTIIWAPQLFSIIFGHKWIMAGIFAQYLSILFFFRFIVSPLTYTYTLANKLREDFILHLLFLFLTTVSFYFSNCYFSDKSYMILFYSITYSLVYILYLVRSYKFANNI